MENKNVNEKLNEVKEVEEVEVLEYDELESEAAITLHCLCGISSGAGA